MKFEALLLVIAASTLAEPSFPPRGSAEQRANFERGQRLQAEFEQRLFVETGFEPLQSVVASGRTVRRVLFHDPYMMLPVPGVEVERAAGDRVVVRVVAQSGVVASAELDPQAWRTLRDLEEGIFAPRPYVPWDPQPTPPVPPRCHGWVVRLAASNSEGQATTSWSQCGGGNDRKAAFAAEMARLAVSSRPGCPFDRDDPFWSFSRCFVPPDPAGASRRN